jgi:hypothetical protein
MPCPALTELQAPALTGVMSDTNTPIDPDTGLPLEDERPTVGGGGETVEPPSIHPPEDPTPPDAPVGEPAEGQDSLMSPDLAGDTMFAGGDELGGADTVLENDELEDGVERP